MNVDLVTAAVPPFQVWLDLPDAGSSRRGVRPTAGPPPGVSVLPDRGADGGGVSGHGRVEGLHRVRSDLHQPQTERGSQPGPHRGLLQSFYVRRGHRVRSRSRRCSPQAYVDMRKIGSGRGMVSAYPRQLESLIRLAEAHAKVRFSEKVETIDVEEAKRLHREALKQSATDPRTGFVDISILTTGT